VRVEMFPVQQGVFARNTELVTKKIADTVCKKSHKCPINNNTQWGKNIKSQVN